jgi:hypothetical protein
MLGIYVIDSSPGLLGVIDRPGSHLPDQGDDAV